MALLVAQNPQDAHVSVLDWETPIHFGIGVGAGFVGVSGTTAILFAIGAEAAYRAAEYGARQALFKKVVPASSLANQAADVASTALGIYVGRWLARRASA